MFTRKFPFVFILPVLFLLVLQTNAVSAFSPSWHQVEYQNFDNGDAIGWSGGSISSGVYQVSGSSDQYLLTKTIPGGLNLSQIRVSLYMYAETSTPPVDLVFRVVNSSGSFALASQRGNPSASITWNNTIPYDPAGFTLTVYAGKSGYGTLTVKVDNFYLYIYGERFAFYDFGNSSQATHWSGGSISSGVYTSNALNELNFNNIYYNSYNKYILAGKFTYSFAASTSRVVTVNIGNTQIYTATGTSGSFSNWNRWVILQGINPYIYTTQSGALTSQTLTIDDIAIIRLVDPPFTVNLKDETTKNYYYNASLTYTYYAYTNTGSYTTYPITSLITEFNFPPPPEGDILVQYGSQGYIRKIINPNRVQDYYLCPIENVMQVQVAITDYTGLWGPLQKTRINLYDQTGTYKICDAWVDVGYKAIIYPAYLGQYRMIIQSAYATYTVGLYYALSNTLSVAINFAPSGSGVEVNATRLDWNTIRVIYNDPQSLTYNVTVNITNLFGMEFINTVSNSTAIWDIANFTNIVPVRVNVSAWVATNLNSTPQLKTWIIYIPISNMTNTNGSYIYNYTITPIAPPFDLTLQIAGFPVMPILILFTTLFIVFQFPSPYLRYAILFFGGIAFFLAYSNWLPTIPQLGWTAIGVICVIYALIMRGRA